VYKAASPGAGLILCKDPDALAVAMLTGIAWKRSATFLDRPDLRTGVAPRFWRDFVDALTAPLPPALIEITDLVEVHWLERLSSFLAFGCRRSGDGSTSSEVLSFFSRTQTGLSPLVRPWWLKSAVHESVWRVETGKRDLRQVGEKSRGRWF
jgi:hypothetical protein